MSVEQRPYLHYGNVALMSFFWQDQGTVGASAAETAGT
jgi:hypothetical protein